MTAAATLKQRDKVAAYLLELKEKGHYPTIPEVQVAMNCGANTVITVRQQLIAQGLYPVPPRTSAGAHRVRMAPPAGKHNIERIVKSTLTPEEQRNLLSTLAQEAMREETRVAALAALRQLDAVQGVRQKGGPGIPKTVADAKDRLQNLFNAVPPSLRAHLRALPEPVVSTKGATDEVEQLPEPGADEGAHDERGGGTPYSEVLDPLAKLHEPGEAVPGNPYRVLGSEGDSARSPEHDGPHGGEVDHEVDNLRTDPPVPQGDADLRGVQAEAPSTLRGDAEALHTDSDRSGAMDEEVRRSDGGEREGDCKEHRAPALRPTGEASSSVGAPEWLDSSNDNQHDLDDHGN